MIDSHGEPVRENYRRQGEVRERERIIELLEGMFDEWVDIRLETLVELIKGKAGQ